jgi:hypothetical protein
MLEKIVTVLISVMMVVSSHGSLAGSVGKSKNRTTITVDGAAYDVGLPDGYCDFSDTGWGLIVRERLEKLSTANPSEAYPKIIYRPCGASINGGLPWGYVGVTPKTPFINSQKAMNKGLSNIFNNGEAMKKLMAENFAENKAVVNDFGFEMSNMVSGKPYLVLANENIIVYTIIADLKINGEDHKERIIQGLTILPDFVARYSFYDFGASKLDALSYAKLLSISAAHLKSQAH